MAAGGLLIALSAYLAFMALEYRNIVYLASALVSSLLLGLCAGALTCTGQCTRSIDVLGVCPILETLCNDHAAADEAVAAEARTAVPTYA